MKIATKRPIAWLTVLALMFTVCLSGTVLPLAATTETSIITGGDFEAAEGDDVYKKNWVDSVFKDSATSPACTIVEDTAGETAGNHCLKVPLYTEKNHLKNLVFSLYEQGYQPVINRK